MCCGLEKLTKTRKETSETIYMTMLKIQPLSRVFALLLFIVFVYPCNGDTGDETVVVFKGDTTNVRHLSSDGTVTKHTPKAFRVPAFVGGVLDDNKEFLAIMCGAKLYVSEGKHLLIDGVAKTSYGDYNTWSEAEIFTNDTKRSTTHVLRKDFTAVMKEKKIYVLATSYQKKDASATREQSNTLWDPLMFVGTIKDSQGSGASTASITWEEGKSLKNPLAADLSKEKTTNFIGGAGNGVVTKSGAIVFPIYIEQESKQSTSSILYSTDNGTKWQIGKKTEDKTEDGSVVEWGDDKLLYIVSSYSGYRKVFESPDMGSTWSESLMLSGVWGNQPGRLYYGRQGSAIKVPVDGKDVLLFAHPLSEKGGSSTDTLQLWLSDGQRIVRIGTISDEEKETQTGNSILSYVGSHLYITHEINPFGVFDGSEKMKQWDGVIGLSPLPEFLESVKTTVHAWRALDTKLNTKGVPTEALVGFLGNTRKDNSVWEDMYKCVNATVRGGKSVDGGFSFDGNPGSVAQWPVASQGQNQVYIFTNKQFTLAATVTIHTKETNGEFSLLGASLDSQGSNVLLGIGYTHDNKWFAVSHKNQKKTTEETFVRDQEYHVALTFANGAAAVYVDGKQITNKEFKIEGTFSINHFYMGGTGESSTAKGSSCTIKNVMLFNQVLAPKEITKLTELKTASKKMSDTSKSVPKTTSTALPDKTKYVSTTEKNEAAVTSLQTVTNEKADIKNMNKSQDDLRDALFKKDTQGDNGATVSLSAVGLMCLVCSVIALTGL